MAVERRSLKFYQADVFSAQPFGGNPVAIFPEAQGLSDDQLQQIAREMNLSETVFVLPPTDPAAVVRLRIFTPTQEIPFAGHPVVDTMHVLAQLGIDGERALLVTTSQLAIFAQIGRRQAARAFQYILAFFGNAEHLGAEIGAEHRPVALGTQLVGQHHAQGIDFLAC